MEGRSVRWWGLNCSGRSSRSRSWQRHHAMMDWQKSKGQGARAHGRPARSAGPWLGEHLAWVGLLIAGVVSGSLILSLDSQLTFIADDWELLVAREGLSAATIFEPFNENIVAGPAVVYKVLQGTVGMESSFPFYVVSVSLFLASVVLLFVYLRRRLGDWLALIAAILVFFLGAAFEDLLWAFQIGYFASAAAGLAMLLALDREDERGDGLACGLLTLSLVFSSLGLVFLIGFAADVCFGRRQRARRLPFVLLPTSLFFCWWVVWGHQAESHLSGENVTGLISYVFESAAAGITSLLGLAENDGSSPDQSRQIWGKLVLPFVVVAAGFRIWRDKGLSRGMAVALSLALGFWVLAGLNRSDERFPTSSRYQYPSALFLLLVIGESLRGVRLPRPILGFTAIVAVVAAFGGVSLLEREHEERWLPVAERLRVTLAAVELGEPSTDPDFPVTFPPNPTVQAGRYLASARAYGSPSLGEAALILRPESDRASADLTMAQALGLRLLAPEAPSRRCREVGTSSSAEALPSQGRLVVENLTSSSAEVMLKRFADEFSVSLGPLGPGDKAGLIIPADSAKRAWQLGVRASGPVRLCAP